MVFNHNLQLWEYIKSIIVRNNELKSQFNFFYKNILLNDVSLERRQYLQMQNDDYMYYKIIKLNDISLETLQYL